MRCGVLFVIPFCRCELKPRVARNRCLACVSSFVSPLWSELAGRRQLATAYSIPDLSPRSSARQLSMLRSGPLPNHRPWHSALRRGIGVDDEVGVVEEVDVGQRVLGAEHDEADDEGSHEVEYIRESVHEAMPILYTKSVYSRVCHY